MDNANYLMYFIQIFIRILTKNFLSVMRKENGSKKKGHPLGWFTGKPG
jgi:hypothetical protein